MSVPAGPLHAVVPVRGLPAGKVRLSALLTRDQRNRLVRAMLADVVGALQGCPAVDRITIVSRDAAAQREAARLGVHFLAQPPKADGRTVAEADGLNVAEADGLNAAIALARAAAAGAAALLVVPADVPLLTPADVQALLEAAPPPPAVVIVAAADGGTAALLLLPPSVIAPAFGEASARRHARAASVAGAAVRALEQRRWALDIDTPADIDRFLARAAETPEGGRETRACLRAFGHAGPA